VQALLQGGADVDKAKDDDGYTPLSVATLKGHTDIVRLLEGTLRVPSTP
jgi:ankyrin repeat protein